MSTALLRHVYLPTYTASIHPLYTSSPLPEIALPLDDTEPVTTSVLEFRKHETAVLDRYIAIRVGEELRGVESELSEGSGGVEEVFGRFQVGGPCLTDSKSETSKLEWMAGPNYQASPQRGKLSVLAVLGCLR